MGMTRKALSLSTLGLVDFRSDKDRAAANTGRTKREAKKQTKLLKKIEKSQRALARQSAHM